MVRWCAFHGLVASQNLGEYLCVKIENKSNLAQLTEPCGNLRIPAWVMRNWTTNSGSRIFRHPLLLSVARIICAGISPGPFNSLYD